MRFQVRACNWNRTALLVVLSLLPLSAASQEKNEPAPFLYGHDLGITNINPETRIYFALYDGVRDGCWLNPERTVSLAKREFLDAGYTNITEEYGFGVAVRLEAIGYETSPSQCAVHVSFNVGITDGDRREYNDTIWLSFSEKTSFQLGSLLTGPKRDMSMRITEKFAGNIDEFIVHIQQEKNRLEAELLSQDVSEEARASFLNTFVR
jgi:hypothetical protein